jgi:hypothetical protein
MQSEIDALREINSKLLAEVTELRKENAEVKAENVKLKHALEEHEARFTNLEQKDKLITKFFMHKIRTKKMQKCAKFCAKKN